MRLSQHSASTFAATCPPLVHSRVGVLHKAWYSNLRNLVAVPQRCCGPQTCDAVVLSAPSGSVVTGLHQLTYVLMYRSLVQNNLVLQTSHAPRGTGTGNPLVGHQHGT